MCLAALDQDELVRQVPQFAQPDFENFEFFEERKKARRIFAIVSTISIPTSAPIIMEASVDPQPRGPDWMPITPKTGSLFHAETHWCVIAAWT